MIYTYIMYILLVHPNIWFYMVLPVLLTSCEYGQMSTHMINMSILTSFGHRPSCGTQLAEPTAASSSKQPVWQDSRGPKHFSSHTLPSQDIATVRCTQLRLKTSNPLAGSLFNNELCRSDPTNKGSTDYGKRQLLCQFENQQSPEYPSLLCGQTLYNHWIQ